MLDCKISFLQCTIPHLCENQMSSRSQGIRPLLSQLYMLVSLSLTSSDKLIKFVSNLKSDGDWSLLENFSTSAQSWLAALTVLPFAVVSVIVVLITASSSLVFSMISLESTSLDACCIIQECLGCCSLWLCSKNLAMSLREREREGERERERESNLKFRMITSTGNG